MKKVKFRFAKNVQALLLAMLIVPLFSTCKKDEKSDEKVMSAVTVVAGGETISTQLTGSTFEFLVGLDFKQDDLKSAKVNFTLSEKATSDPASGATVDLSVAQGVKFTVKAENGSTAEYTVKKIDGTSDKAEFTSFKLKVGDEEFLGTVVNADSKVTFASKFPYALLEDLADATPTFEWSIGATVSPATGVKRDFTKDVTYDITAHDGTKRTWTVVIEIAEPSKAAAITSFKLQVDNRVVGDEVHGTADLVTIDADNNLISFYMPGWMPGAGPYGLALIELLPEAIPVFTLSPFATSDVVSGEEMDFSGKGPWTINVTAQDGETTETWTIKRLLRTETHMNAFWVDVSDGIQSVQIQADINSETSEITLVLPAMPQWFTSANLSDVAPSMFDPAANVTIVPDYKEKQDFTKAQGVVYTLTAEDGETTETWTVKLAPYYLKEKWSVDYADLRDRVTDAGPQNPNSIALVGNYIALGRTADLLNKSDGSLAADKLNVAGWRAWNNQAANEADPFTISQDFPFFIANDDAGNMIGINLGAWNPNTCVVAKWTSPTAAPEVVMELSTRLEPEEGEDVGVQFGSFGRKLQVIGDVNNNGLIISTNSVARPDIGNSSMEHYLWKIQGGIADIANPTLVESRVPWGSNSYQLLTPLGIEPVPPYFIGSHSTTINDVAHYPTLQYGIPGSTTSIPGPFGSILGANAMNGWGTLSWHYHKLFEFDGKNMIATFSNTSDFYCFSLLENNAGELNPIVATTIPWNGTDWANGNVTGSFALEQVGSNILFYVFPTNRGVFCYELNKF